MSYEGYEELLCANGHYTTHDCYDDAPKACWFCGERFTHSHAVNQTNGYDEGEPYACDAPKTVVGTDDDWRVDHHGNRYSLAVQWYQPGKHW